MSTLVQMGIAAADGAMLDEIEAKLPDRLAPMYERGMSKHAVERA